MRSIRVRLDELRGEGSRGPGNASDVWGSETARNQCGAMLDTLLHQPAPGRAGSLRQFAEPRVPMRRMYLQRMMQDVAQEHCAAGRIGQPQRNMARRVAGCRDDRQAVFDRMVAVDQNRLTSLDDRQDAVAIGTAALKVGVRRRIASRI